MGPERSRLWGVPWDAQGAVSQEDVPEEQDCIVRCPNVPLPGCVALTKLLTLSELQSPHRQNGSQGCKEDSCT